MRAFRIRLPAPLFPLQAFLNVWPDEDYLPMLDRMSTGIESAYNDVGWSWWNGEDEHPPKSGQLRFFVLDEELDLPALEALKHFHAATEAWLLSYPALRPKALKVLADIERLFST